jgi:hypothetical protein
MTEKTETRYGRVFGSGDIWPRSFLRKDDLSNMTRDDRLLAIGFSHACPVVHSVVKDYGYDWTLRRYIGCNWIYQHEILPVLKETNPNLFEKIITPVPRILTELPDFKIDRNLVPKSFEIEMSPLSTPYGYALPRLVDLYVKGKEKNGSYEGKYQEIRTGLKTRVNIVKIILNNLAHECTDPIEFTVKLAGRIHKLGVDPLKIFDHLLSKGKLKEENCKTMYHQIFGAMEKFTPELSHTYKQILRDEGEVGLHEFGIVVPSDLK